MSRHEPPHNSILIAVRREKSLMNFFHLFFVIFFSSHGLFALCKDNHLECQFSFLLPFSWEMDGLCNRKPPAGFVEKPATKIMGRSIHSRKTRWRKEQEQRKTCLATWDIITEIGNKKMKKKISSSTSFLLVPAGTKVSGKLEKIERVSNARWLLTSGEKYEEAK